MQVVLEQSEPAPWNEPPMLLHCCWVATKQKPLGAQHAPVVGPPPHVVFVQCEPAPCQVPPLAVHCASVVWTHRPLGTQHAPVGVGVHETLAHD